MTKEIELKRLNRIGRIVNDLEEPIKQLLASNPNKLQQKAYKLVQKEITKTGKMDELDREEIWQDVQHWLIMK